MGIETWHIGYNGIFYEKYFLASILKCSKSTTVLILSGSLFHRIDALYWKDWLNTTSLVCGTQRPFELLYLVKQELKALA